MKILEQLNQVQVTAEELDTILAEAEEWEAEGRGGEGAGLFLVANHYPGDHISAFAVYSRLETLVELIYESESRGWVLPAIPNDTICTRFELIATAASERQSKMVINLLSRSHPFTPRLLKLQKPKVGHSYCPTNCIRTLPAGLVLC